jgi:adenylate cyclase
MKQPVERRLAAILAADMAGYSRLMGLDEAGTAQALREHRAAADPLIAQHGGRIVKTTGDGVLIEFSSVGRSRPICDGVAKAGDREQCRVSR